MNQRIKELAREAGLLVHNPEGMPTKLELFSELLIQECAGLVDHVYMENGTSRGDFIRKHFGVTQ
jgi:hypothetical protein